MQSAGSDEPIFLVGMMGAGKSAVGARLASALGRRFVDLDTLVEGRAGETIAAMFAAGREDEFRKLEHLVLRGFDATGTIVATGGGIVLSPQNVDYMIGRGRVVYLRAEIPTLLRRIEAASAVASRPLLAQAADPEARLSDLLAARRDAYQRAHLVLDTDRRSLDEVVEALREVIEGGA